MSQTESQFTPGPWKVKFKKNCDWTIRGANGYQILGIPHDDDYGDTPADRANAHLIAAAPCLFSALVRLIEATTMPATELHRQIMEAKELIARIEGNIHGKTGNAVSDS